MTPAPATDYGDSLTTRARTEAKRSMFGAASENSELLLDLVNALETEQTMHAAWEKRAYEAEKEAALMRAEAERYKRAKEQAEARADQLAADLADARAAYAGCNLEAEAHLERAVQAEARAERLKGLLKRCAHDFRFDCKSAIDSMVHLAASESPELPEEAAGWWASGERIKALLADIDAALADPGEGPDHE